MVTPEAKQDARHMKFSYTSEYKNVAIIIIIAHISLENGFDKSLI